jgi:isoleucyl-tRNA synthetase
MKDVVPRFWTMRGRYVERRWGWDCHGLPIENIVEKELGFKSKKEIEEFGVDKFNEACRSKVLAYAAEWETTISRLGRWVDFKNGYSTMDVTFMESVWWVFKQLYDNGLVYKDYRSIYICPRCETTLSQQEVSEGYKDIKDLSVTAKFELIDEPGTFILAWTTTPWTLPGNVALAVNQEIQYVRVLVENSTYILAQERAEDVLKGIEYVIVDTIKGSELVGKSYKPLFPYFDNDQLENRANGFKIYVADFVLAADGTGVVHIAPAFGEDDMRLGREKQLPFIQHVGMDGRFTSDVVDFAGQHVKPIEDVQKTDVEIIKYLAAKGLLFSKEKYEHSYPHCWRCDTPLLNYATTSWFVRVTAIKEKALELAQQINWSPEHIKEGRFGKWLEGARDWSVSRQRYWASVMPIWECECGERVVIGSIAELEKLSGKKVTDIHKHVVDGVTFPCTKCQQTMKRIPDVLDTWFDSGSMPYAQQHYPFENEKQFDQSFPAEFIAEGLDQTRAWFYYLHVIASGIKEQPAFKNVIVNGIVLAEDGKKMAKKLKNYPDPNVVLDSYGADALRFYLLSSPVMEAENLNFSEKGVKEALQKVVMLLDNIVLFYQLYASGVVDENKQPNSDSVLDRWIVTKLNQLVNDVTVAMEKYQLVKAVRPIELFINELSTWYVRRSRDRFKDGDGAAVATLGYILATLSKVMAPFTPFAAETVYQQLTGNESVHLAQWPETQVVDAQLLAEMELAQQIVERGLAARAGAGIKVRQPLQAYCSDVAKQLSPGLAVIVCDELNIKQLQFGEEKLDVELTDALRLEGVARELIRHINQLRKESGLSIQDQIVIHQQGFDEVVSQYRDEILKATLATNIVIDAAGEMKEIEGGTIGITKV